MTTPIDYQAVLLDLKARRRQLNAAIASIESILTGAGVNLDPDDGDDDLSDYPVEPQVRPLTPTKPRENTSGVVTLQNDTFFGQSTPEAIRKFLQMAKRPRKVKEISEALREGGQVYARDEVTSYNNTYAALKRMRAAGEAVKIKTGEWGLADWYANKPKSDGE